MRTVFLASSFLICCLLTQAQNLLDDHWKFTTGDNLNWMRTDMDDSKWTEAQIGENWEKWGFSNYDGFAWYRKTVIIPSKLKREVEKKGGLVLKLARIDDVDYTYFNGILIGKTGEMPPNLQSKWEVDRVYIIPANLIAWDKPNSIAVRVFDSSGNGGIYGKDISLMIRGAEDMFKLSTAIKEPDHVINGVTDYKLPFELQSESSDKIDGKFKVIVCNDYFDTIAINEESIKLNSNSKKTIYCQLKGLKPGIYLVSATFSSSVAYKSIKFNFAIDPEKMTTLSDTPSDFVNYWARAKRELAAVEPQYKLIKVDSLSTPARDCYLVEMRSLGNVLVRAWLLTPKKAGNYPAVLSLPGHTSFMQPKTLFNDDKFVSMGLDIRGHGNSKDNVNPGFSFPGYICYQLEDKEQFIYRGAYMDCVRAIEFLFSRSDVDTSRVAVEGGSQGGALSFATAAFCGNRIKAVVAAVPFLSNFPEYMKVAPNWPSNEWKEYAKNHSMDISSVLKTLSYFDIKNLAPLITAPLFMGVGLVDITCPPRINFAAYNNLKVEKKYIVYPYSGHAIPGEFRNLKEKFIKDKLGIISTQ